MTTVNIRIGDCRTLLAAMPDQSVHCCVTSPPYFGLRDYGVDGQIGLEQTPSEYVAEMVAVFREVRRVLRDDGTLWLNLGDSYSSPTKGGGGTAVSASMMNRKSKESAERSIKRQGMTPRKFDAGGLAAKQLLGIPWRVAFALQADGWFLRQDIIWNKPNPMPESVRDRCTKAHEYIFMLSKSARYYFDSEEIKEPALTTENRSGRGKYHLDNTMKARGLALAPARPFRNRRSVWTVSTKPFKGAHFATFPPDLIEPCILAGCPQGGTVLDPFGGAGTTGLVAKQHGRNAILLELNPEYAAMARERIDNPPAAKRKRAVNDNTPTADLFDAA